MWFTLLPAPIIALLTLRLNAISDLGRLIRLINIPLAGKHCTHVVLEFEEHSKLVQ